MIPRIKTLEPLNDYRLRVTFDDGKTVIYDVKEDIDALKGYRDLAQMPGLFKAVQVDPSRTCVYWTDDIDLPSDMIYEYGRKAGY